VCENGFGKRTDYGEYSVQRRSGQGVINIKTSERNGKVVALINVSDDDEIMMMTANGMVIRASISTIRSIGRNTQGVTLISLKKGDKLVSVAPVISDGKGEDEDEEGEEEQTEQVDDAE
jgi:DNA gyrase subunit A